jgi:hypothetical protein
MEGAIAVLIVILYLWNGHNLQKKRLADNARLIYFTSVKPALISLGFVGSILDVVETPNEVETLCYLKKISRIKSELKRVAGDVAKVELDETELQSDSPRFKLICTDKIYEFQITFKTILDDHRSKSTLTFELFNNGEYLRVTRVCSIIAPAYYFNKTNLDWCIDMFIREMISYEVQNRAGKSFWLVYGADNKDLESVCNLPLLNKDTPSKYWKKADKVIKQGYSH